MIMTGWKQIHFIFTDELIRFVVTGRKKNILYYRQKSIPHGLIIDGKIQDESELIQQMKKWLKENKIGSMRAYFCIPDGQAIVRKVTVPNSVAKEELKGHLYMEIGETIHLPFNDPVLEVIDLRESEEFKEEVIFIATRESIVQEYSELLRKLKFEPTVADLSFLSVYRLTHHLHMTDDEEPTMLAQINRNDIQITIFYKHIPLYVHHSRLDDELPIEIIRNDEGNDELIIQEENKEHIVSGSYVTIASQMERINTFFTYNISKGSSDVKRMIVSGTHPLLKEITYKLKDHFTIPVYLIDEECTSSLLNANAPFYFADCIGLSLK